MTETKESLFRTQRDQERSVDELKTQLHAEATNRRLAEQRAETSQAQLDELRRSKVRVRVGLHQVPKRCRRSRDGWGM